MLIILTGKSCAGKDTLKQAFLNKGAISLLSDTTRPMREGEKQGKQYNFIESSDFNKDTYIEYREVRDKNTQSSILYGTPKKELDNDKTYITIKDRSGAEALKDYYGKDNVFIAYLDIPYDIRRRRSFIRDNGYKDAEWINKWNTRALMDDNEFRDIYKTADIIYDNKSLADKEDMTALVEKTLIFINALKDGQRMTPIDFEVEGSLSLAQRHEDEIER